MEPNDDVVSATAVVDVEEPAEVVVVTAGELPMKSHEVAANSAARAAAEATVS